MKPLYTNHILNILKSIYLTAYFENINIYYVISVADKRKTNILQSHKSRNIILYVSEGICLPISYYY